MQPFKQVVATLVGLWALAGCAHAAGPVAARQPESAVQAHATGPAWYAVQLHCHSTYSDGKLGVKQLIAEAKAAGLDALAITDHATTTQWLDPDFVAEEGLVMMHSEEGSGQTGGNHIGLHGFTGITPIPYSMDRDAILAQAVARQATIIINHPCNNMLPWSPLTLDARAHAVEVWNSWFWSPVDYDLGDDATERSWRPNEEAIAWWADNLSQGAHVAAIAAADFHQKPQQVGTPCTMIFAQERSEKAILAGLRAGHTLLVTSPQGERVELAADNDGDGRFEAMVGDTVKPGANFRMKVTGAKGCVIRVMRGQTEVLRERVNTDNWGETFALPPGDGAPFVYARLDGSSLPAATVRAMTSAIYLR